MRHKKAPVRKIQPEYKYNSIQLSKFINRAMLSGKKSVARTQIYKALDKLAELTATDAIIAFDKAIQNVMPKVEVRARRVGGANYQVPTPVREARQYALAYKWLVEQTRAKRTKEEFWKVLADELAAAFNGTGDAVKKRDEIHRMADANKAFAHLAW